MSADLEVKKCGTCAGCLAERMIDNVLAELDKYINGRIERLTHEVDTMVFRDPVAERARRREVHDMLEYKSRVVSYLVRTIGMPGCFRVVLQKGNAT